MAVSAAATADAGDWSHIYHQNLRNSSSPPMFGQSSDSTVVTTVSSSPPTAGIAIEGRIGKSSKRRTRASRRSPTTMLNTDTTNFRALVQQFTGLSSEPYTAGPLISFNAPPPVSYELMQKQQQYHMHHQQQQQYQVAEYSGFNGGYVRNPRADVAPPEGFFFDAGSGEAIPRTSNGSW